MPATVAAIAARLPAWSAGTPLFVSGFSPPPTSAVDALQRRRVWSCDAAAYDVGHLRGRRRRKCGDRGARGDDDGGQEVSHTHSVSIAGLTRRSRLLEVESARSVA